MKSKINSKILNKQKKQDDDIEEFIDPTSVILQQLGHSDPLESYGILIIDDTITKQSIARATKKLLEYHFDSSFDNDVQIILNSPGGYLDAGHAFIDLMGWVRHKVRTVALGHICSMATLIFIHGDERIMAPNSIAMIHQFSGGNVGNYTDLVAGRKYEDLEMQRHINMFIECSKYKTEKEIRQYLLKNTDNYLTPKEMIKHGLCEGIFEPNKPKRQNIDKKKIQRNNQRKSKR